MRCLRSTTLTRSTYYSEPEGGTVTSVGIIQPKTKPGAGVRCYSAPLLPGSLPGPLRGAEGSAQVRAGGLEPRALPRRLKQSFQMAWLAKELGPSVGSDLGLFTLQQCIPEHTFPVGISNT